MVTNTKLAGGRPIGHVGIDMADRQRGERAAEAAEQPGDHELGMDQPGTDRPRNSTRISLSRSGIASAPATEWK